MQEKPRRLTVVLIATITAVAAATVSACGGTMAGDDADGSSIEVVATTTQIADLARNVGGERIGLTQILQPGSDPHRFEPRPSDVAATASAALVFSNGQDLDPWAEQLVSDSGGQAEIVDLSASLPDPLANPSREQDKSGDGEESHEHEDEHADHGEGDHGHEDESHGHGEREDEHDGHDHGDHGDHGHGHEDEEHGDHVHDSELDPHWWHDPHNAVAAVETIAERLAESDPAGADEYEANAAAYIERVERLDGQIAACVDRLPEARRKLVTDHEAFGYFAHRYGLEVVGALIPAMTTQAQPSARDLSDLAQAIRDEEVAAIFPEASLSPKLAESIAAQTGATAEHTLYGDALGPADSDGATYLEMMAANAGAIVDGLGAGKVRCELEAN